MRIKRLINASKGVKGELCVHQDKRVFFLVKAIWEFTRQGALGIIGKARDQCWEVPMLKCNPVYLFMVFGVVFALVSGCSGGAASPTSPATGDNNTDGRSPLQERALTPADWVGHEPMAFCTFVIDTEKMTIEVLEERTIAAHWNVRPLLENPLWCPNMNCIAVYLTNFDPVTKVYTIDVHLRNPTNVVGYDVRGIMFLKPDKPIALLNPDDYIDLYDPLAQINPFRSFAKTAPNRQFPPAGEYNEIYKIYIPPPPPLFNINYAIDVSWPNNCREPYDIEDIEYTGALTPSGGSGTISCKVYDHQDDIESVQVSLHGFTGGTEDLTYDAVEGVWSITFSNEYGAAVGEYQCLLSAKSTEYYLKLYNYVTVEVIPGADQYIKGRVFDAYTMADLDGAEVSVVNQDILGFQPAPAYVADGAYEVAVEPGTYDMQVSTVSYDIMRCTGVIVPTEDTYEIDFGLNIYGDPNYNPYPYTGGVVGKVTDAVTGTPIPEAAVIVNSEDLNTSNSPHPTFAGGAACKDSGYYSVTEICASPDNWMYTPAYIWEIYCSAPGYEAEEISGGFMVEHNIVVPNMHFQLTPIEPGKTVVYHEDFESGKDWTYYDYSPMGYGGPSQWHVQEWDAGIINMCVTNGWTYLAPDEADGGIIPEPLVSQYNPGPNESYLWYGRADQGSFLGDYDPGMQIPGDGGTSNIDHGGYAISPDIDPSGFSNGLLALESFWEIESQNPRMYDYCEIFIRGDTGVDNFIAFLNPAVDPGTSGDPISSGGHFRDGVWDHLVYDISPYMSNTKVNVVFRFYTHDNLYNGFKGWFIDNVYIYGY